MGSKTKIGVAVVALIVALGLGTACSSDDSTSTGSSASGSSQGSVNKEYESWCSSVQDLIDQSSPNDLSAIGDLAAFSQAITSLAATAPQPIQAQMQTLATATQAKLTAVQQDPTATLPPALADEAATANDEVTTFVSENCGLTLPTIDL